MSLDTFYGEHPKGPQERALPAVHGFSEDPTGPFRAWTERHEG